LVVVPNSKGPNFPVEAHGFSETPTEPFSFRSIVVVSDNDPYGSPEHAERLAVAWGSRVVHIGDRGHINATSGLAAWPEGYELLNQIAGLTERHRKTPPANGSLRRDNGYQWTSRNRKEPQSSRLAVLFLTMVR
jgi:Serine hydrolase